MTITFRPATPADYAAIATVSQAAVPEFAITESKLQHLDAQHPAHCKLGYSVAIVQGEIVGYGRYIQHPDLYHPHKFHLTVRVHPKFWTDGLYEQLLSALHTTLAPFDPIETKLSIRETYPDEIKIAQQLGYHAYSRRFESVLDVNSFNLSTYQDRLQHVSEQGIKIYAYAELAHDPERDQKLYALFNAVDGDVPLAEQITVMSFEQWHQQIITSPEFLAEGTFIALDGEDYVGLSIFFKHSDHMLYIDLSGVQASHRRRGITTAIKLRGIAWAQTAGYHHIGTTNDDGNTGILAINEKLGFVRQPTMIQFAKTFPQES